MPDDRIQREIEDILSRLDSFVPEEGVGSRMRRRSSDATSAFMQALLAPLARISLRHVMLTALVLVVVAFFGMRVNPLIARWAMIAGLILLFTSFALSFFGRGSPSVERRWRGRPMALNEPGLRERLRAWFQTRRRPPGRW